MEDEEWKPVSGYGGKYEVSSRGNVRKKTKNGTAPVAANRNSCGYYQLHLQLEGKRKTVTVHRLVAMHFIPNPNNYPQINHIDGNKANNSVENIEWCTASQNTKHAFDTGLKEATRKASSINAKKRHREVVEAHIRKSSKPIEVTNVRTGEKMIFPSANEAARALGVSQGNLSAVCNGRITKTAGYTARYLEVCKDGRQADEG